MSPAINGEEKAMPRCESCGKFTKNPHREVDGRVERAYCELCHSERKWKLNGDYELKLKAPDVGWWSKVKRFLRL